MTLGQRIIEARKAMDPPMTPADLAKASGVPYSTIKGIEDGHQASSTKLPAIAAALSVNPTWLQTGKGPRKAGQAPDQSAVEASIEGLWYAIAGLASSMVIHRPVEALGTASALRKGSPRALVQSGFVHELIAILERAGKPETQLATERSEKQKSASAR